MRETNFLCASARPGGYRGFLALLACGIAAFAAAEGEALGQAMRFTQQEIRALPRVCLAQQFVNTWLHEPMVPEAERKIWAERLGEKDYIHFHHYCAGLIDMRQAAAAVKETERQSAYRRAVSNFEYVQRNASSAFALMPQVNVQKGLTFRLMGDHGAAAVEFNEAIRLKSDYSPAYSALADLFVDLDDVESAIEVLNRGLRAAPKSKILATKLTELEQSVKPK